MLIICNTYIIIYAYVIYTLNIYYNHTCINCISYVLYIMILCIIDLYVITICILLHCITPSCYSLYYTFLHYDNALLVMYSIASIILLHIIIVLFGAIFYIAHDF